MRGELSESSKESRIVAIDLKFWYLAYMPNRSRKPRMPDPSVFAFNLAQAITGEPPVEALPPDGKDPAAVALGRKGGLKGGKARAASMTPKQRTAAAKKAAAARWGKQKDS